jgi:hypothetical protein
MWVLNSHRNRRWTNLRHINGVCACNTTALAVLRLKRVAAEKVRRWMPLVGPTARFGMGQGKEISIPIDTYIYRMI